jgi:hypothetical protein
MSDRRDLFLVQVPGWLLLLYLVYAQVPAAIDYDIGVRMGTQEPAASITEVGAAFWYGFAFADLVVYIPLLAAGLVGFRRSARWGRVLLGAALGITIYWPVVVLAAAFDARDAAGWAVDETPYWIVLPIIFLWALIAFVRVSAASSIVLPRH